MADSCKPREKLAPSNEYDWTIHARRRCDLLPYYCDPVAYLGFCEGAAEPKTRGSRRRGASGVECGEGLSPPHWRRGLVCPLPRNLKKCFWFNVFKKFLCSGQRGGGIAQCPPPLNTPLLWSLVCFQSTARNVGSFIHSGFSKIAHKQPNCWSTSTISMFTRLTRNALILSGWLWAWLASWIPARASGYSASYYWRHTPRHVWKSADFNADVISCPWHWVFHHACCKPVIFILTSAK